MEFCHNIACFPQPVPFKSEGGDCFCCGLVAALRWMYPEKPITFEQAFEFFYQEGHSGDPVFVHSWPGYRKTFSNAHQAGYWLDYTADIVRPEYEPERWPHNYHRLLGGLAYDTADMVEGYLRREYVGWTSIAYDGEGPRTKDGKWNDGDHIVLIDGVRRYWARENGKAKGLRVELHVVCSAQGGRTYWEEAGELMHEHGMGSFWFLRRQVEYPTVELEDC
ncbi:MAG: hypothetical protein JSS66_06320 [Armatimonadetes bacterium]|nr:hypothetical protein [Armatimonadota bacterium]